MILNGKKLDSDASFLYIALTQAAIKVHETGRDKDFFIEFCKEIWESMLLSDTDTLKEILIQYTVDDLKKKLKE